jgi:hypothetical protein
MSDPPFFVFQADTIEAMRQAFEEVCGTLQLTKKGDQPRRSSRAASLSSPWPASMTRLDLPHA